MNQTLKTTTGVSMYTYGCFSVYFVMKHTNLCRVYYRTIFGGVTAFTKDQFMSVNGFSNKYYGWGGEDDDMHSR